MHLLPPQGYASSMPAPQALRGKKQIDAKPTSYPLLTTFGGLGYVFHSK